MPINTKYATMIDQALEGLEQAIKARSEKKPHEGVSALEKFLRRLIEEEEDTDEKKPE